MSEWERGLAVVILNYNGYELTIESTKNFRKRRGRLPRVGDGAGGPSCELMNGFPSVKKAQYSNLSLRQGYSI